MKDIKLLACGSDRRVIATPPERNEKGIDRYLGRICMLHEQTAYERRHSLCGSLEIGAHDGCVFHFMLKTRKPARKTGPATNLNETLETH